MNLDAGAMAMLERRNSMRFIAVVLAGACMTGCTGVREPTTLTAPDTPAQSPDYAVYDAVLEALFVADAPAGTSPLHVIIDSTSPGAPVGPESFRREFGAFFPIVETITPDYALRSKVRVPLDARAFRARGRIELVSGQTLASLDRSPTRNPDSFWRAFYTRFPGSHGSIDFSRPGYDSSGTHALLSYGHGCGGLCGDWGIILLERRGDTWVVLRRVITAMS
jgi:hypothetical protein